jgi:hypothetical protein
MKSLLSPTRSAKHHRRVCLSEQSQRNCVAGAPRDLRQANAAEEVAVGEVAGAPATPARPIQPSPPCATSILQDTKVSAELRKDAEYIRVDMVREILQRVGIQRCKCRIVLCQIQALVVGIRVVLDFAVGDLRDVVETVTTGSV